MYVRVSFLKLNFLIAWKNEDYYSILLVLCTAQCQLCLFNLND